MKRGPLLDESHGYHVARLATFAQSGTINLDLLYKGGGSQLLPNYRVHVVCFLGNGDWLFYCRATKFPGEMTHIVPHTVNIPINIEGLADNISVESTNRVQ